MAPASFTVGIDLFDSCFLVGSNVQDESMDMRDEESAEAESIVLDDHDESDTDDASDDFLDEKDTVLGLLILPSSTSCVDGITSESNFRGKGSEASLPSLDHGDECEASLGWSPNEK
jgi:hypothetical protein